MNVPVLLLDPHGCVEEERYCPDPPPPNIQGIRFNERQPEIKLDAKPEDTVKCETLFWERIGSMDGVYYYQRRA
jgi:hypothetical protein